MSKLRSPREVCSTTIGTRSRASWVMAFWSLLSAGGFFGRLVVRGRFRGLGLLRGALPGLLLRGLGVRVVLGRLLVDLHVVHQPSYPTPVRQLLAHERHDAVCDEAGLQLLRVRLLAAGDALDL